MHKFTGMCLITRDVRRLSAFYSTILEAQVEGDDEHAVVFTEGMGMAIFAERGMELMAPGSMRGAGVGSFTMEFQVEDADSEYERLSALGVEIIHPPQTYPWGRRPVWLRDPDGNIVNFYQVVMTAPPDLPDGEA